MHGPPVHRVPWALCGTIRREGGTTMKVGIMTLSVDVAALAQRAEALGFDAIWIPEHTATPVHIAPKMTTYRLHLEADGTPKLRIDPASLRTPLSPWHGLQPSRRRSSWGRGCAWCQSTIRCFWLSRSRPWIISRAGGFSLALGRGGSTRRPRLWGEILRIAGGRPGKQSSR